MDNSKSLDEEITVGLQDKVLARISPVLLSDTPRRRQSLIRVNMDLYLTCWHLGEGIQLPANLCKLLVKDREKSLLIYKKTPTLVFYSGKKKTANTTHKPPQV